MKIIINQVPAEGLYLEEKIEPAQLDLETALIRFRSPLKLAARITRITNALTIDLNINRATKLMRLHNETLEALNRYRRKGEQRITIQHVQVNDGGQAIVAGEMSRGGGDVHKKS